MKTCFKCNQRKDTSEFYGHPSTKDRHLNKCKTCTKKDVRVGTIPRKCDTCGKDFMAVATEVKRGGGKTCSRSCYYARSRKLLEVKFANKTTYATIHKWVYKVGGRPSMCSQCGTTEAKAYEWANVSGEYKQDISDWKRMCKKCHHKYDSISEKLWYKRRHGVHSPKCMAAGVRI